MKLRTTCTPAKSQMLGALGIVPIVVDVFGSDALAQAIATAQPDIVIHQLHGPTERAGHPRATRLQEANRRLRIEGTRNLVQATKMAAVRRAIAQSIAFVYAPGERMLDLAAVGARLLRVQGVIALERQILETPDIDGVVLRYGHLYGPDTWYAAPPKPPSVYVDAAAHAALLAMSKGAGAYNIADDDGAVSSAKAKSELGFDPALRIS
jgi:nucleoside-diphosphate-sugar epimerase